MFHRYLKQTGIAETQVIFYYYDMGELLPRNLEGAPIGVLRFPMSLEDATNPARLAHIEEVCARVLGLTGVRLTVEYPGNAPDATPPNPEELLENDERLDMKVDKLIKLGETDSSKRYAGRTIHALSSKGVATTRTLLVYGRSAVQDFEGIGKHGMKLIDNAIAQTDNDLRALWKAEPAMADLARICRATSDLPAPLLGFSELGLNYSVEDVLDMSEDQLARRVARRMSQSHRHKNDQERVSEIVEDIKRKANRVALDFLAAKQTYYASLTRK
jgi:hypothetical protein